MGRRPRDNDDDISLFPFLSIIASVIGVLTMMIATLALAQTDTPDVAMIEEYEQTQKELSETEEQVQQLKIEISKTNSDALKVREQKQTLDITVEELKTILAELEAIEKELSEQQEVKVVIPEIDVAARETAADMAEQAETLKEELAQLEKELSSRTSAKEANVTVLPQGSGLDFKPHFVECAADSIVMHNVKPTKRVRNSDVTKDETFLELLNLVANGTNDSIVFLVRNDGIKTFKRCKKICDDREIRNGKLPVVGQGRIDLGAF